MKLPILSARRYAGKLARNKYFIFILLSVILWSLFSLIIINYYYENISTTIYAEKLKIAKEQAKNASTALTEKLRFYKEISMMGSLNESVVSNLILREKSKSEISLTTDLRKELWSQDTSLALLNSYFFNLSKNLQIDAIYLLDKAGNCVASSNANTKQSFVGTDYSYRDYYKKTLGGRASQQYAMGAISKNPGLYYSTPVLLDGQLIGVMVVKQNIDSLRSIAKAGDLFISDINGVVILASDKALEQQQLENQTFNETVVSEKELFSMYGRSKFNKLKITPWQQAAFPESAYLNDSHSPVILANENIPDDLLTIHAYHPLQELAILEIHREAQFILLVVAGSFAIFMISGLIFYLREARKIAENTRIAATAFETQQGIMVTNPLGVILRVNKAFTAITGYSLQELVGHSSRLFSSGRHDSSFFADMRTTLKAHDAWQGEIWNRHKNGALFPGWVTISTVKNEAGLVTHCVASFVDISIIKNAESQLQRLAFYDPLTDLPNRRLFSDRLLQVLSLSERHQRKGAILFIDLDDFKDINDSMGHEQGDLVLKHCAKQFISCIREGDTVSRFGSDEFVVLLENLSENDQESAIQAEIVGDKIIRIINQTYKLGTHKHHHTCGIGVTMFGGAHNGTVEDHIQRAELAMFQAKVNGRNSIRFFDPKMHADVAARVALEADLREAVAQNQFTLFYQTQVNQHGLETGVEALVRWQHPIRGVVPPNDFILLAEETGLILPIGRWVLVAACAQLVAWSKQADMRHLTIAVNVSAREFRDKDYVQDVVDVLNLTGVDPTRLKLELTESVFVHDVEDIIEKMKVLKSTGLSFSLDDFGTGYSSLSYLKRLPLDQLKIDKGFVQNIMTDSNDVAIAKMIIVLAKSLGLSVIAEGVETESQRKLLALEGCMAYQGYLFGRPLALEEYEAYSHNAPATALRPSPLND